MIYLKYLAQSIKRQIVLLAIIVTAGLVLAALPAITGILPAQSAFAAPAGSIKCDKDYKLLGILPGWYKYFGDDYGEVVSDNPFIDSNNTKNTCGIIGGELTDHLVQIGLAIIDILLRLGALVAVAFIIMGGYKYMSSQGEPKNIEAAMATLVNSVIGLGIVVTATALVAFIGNKLGG